MADERFSLTWKDFHIRAPEAFCHLLDDTNFSDVTLVSADDKLLKAHKVILSACSPFFKNILVQHVHQNPLLYLKGVKANELRSILKFVYQGECEISQDNLEDFLMAGMELKIDGLADMDAENRGSDNKDGEGNLEGTVACIPEEQEPLSENEITNAVVAFTGTVQEVENYLDGSLQEENIPDDKKSKIEQHNNQLRATIDDLEIKVEIGNKSAKTKPESVNDSLSNNQSQKLLKSNDKSQAMAHKDNKIKGQNEDLLRNLSEMGIKVQKVIVHKKKVEIDTNGINLEENEYVSSEKSDVGPSTGYSAETDNITTEFANMAQYGVSEGVNSMSDISFDSTNMDPANIDSSYLNPSIDSQYFDSSNLDSEYLNPSNLDQSWIPPSSLPSSYTNSTFLDPSYANSPYMNPTTTETSYKANAKFTNTAYVNSSSTDTSLSDAMKSSAYSQSMNSRVASSIRVDRSSLDTAENGAIDKGDDGKYQCDQCDYSTGQKSHFKRHKRSVHSASKQEIFVCDQCDYSSNYKHNVTKHKSALHSGKKTERTPSKTRTPSKSKYSFYTARTPSKTKYSFGSADNSLSRDSFSNIESVKEEEEYFCDLCDIKFAMKENFWRHKQIKHEGTRYSCDQCDVQLTIKENLRRHKQRIHGTDLTY